MNIPLPAEFQPSFDRTARSFARAKFESETDPDGYARKLGQQPAVLALPRLTFNDDVYTAAHVLHIDSAGYQFTLELVFAWPPGGEYFVPFELCHLTDAWKLTQLLRGDIETYFAPKLSRLDSSLRVPMAVAVLSYPDDTIKYSRENAVAKFLAPEAYSAVSFLGVARCLGRPIPATASAELREWVSQHLPHALCA
jgi:hypothetical protein